MIFLHIFITQGFLIVITSINVCSPIKSWGPFDPKYGTFSENERLHMLEETKRMFTFGYDSYMEHAFPQDELDPIHCTGRGPDYDDPSNININDVLGDYALTLVDSLDTLAIMGNASEFKNAVKRVTEYVSFNKPNTVQVFEANIRVLGALLSAHFIIIDPVQPFGDMSIDDYDNELLYLANDLASRFLPAFEKTATGIPYPRVNLQTGVPADCINETCTSGAGTLLLEFGVLSRLLADPVYESAARRALRGLWTYRSNVTGLFGNVINIQTGDWVNIMSGVGAGIDSLYEYMFKAFILFGDEEYLKMFNESYETIRYYLRKGRKFCTSGSGFPPIYVNVHMKTGEILNNWIDALQAAWAGLQVLAGDIDEAICTHALYYTIWQRYSALPERFNWHLSATDVHFYPLRPELAESTYLLYQATKNPYYLHVGKEIVENLNNHTKVQCGYATIHDVRNKALLEDRMESFFLSETCKYLYLLFDTDNHVNTHASRYIFSTEGHILPLWRKDLRKKSWEENLFRDEPLMKPAKSVRETILQHLISKEQNVENVKDIVVEMPAANYTYDSCNKIPQEQQYFLPLDGQYLKQIRSLVGLL